MTQEARRIENERVQKLCKEAYQDGYMGRPKQRMFYRPDQKQYDIEYNKGKIFGFSQGPVYNIDSPKLEKMRRAPNAYTKQQISDELRKVVRAAIIKEKSIRYSEILRRHLT